MILSQERLACATSVVPFESPAKLSDAFGAGTCDNPLGSWEKLGQHYYWVTNKKFNYNDARAECEKVAGGQLAEVLNKKTLELFYNVLRGGSGKILTMMKKK